MSRHPVNATANVTNPVVAEARRPFILALEDDGHRSACNTYMLALMSQLVYKPQGIIAGLFRGLTGGQLPHGHLDFGGGEPRRALLVRRVSSEQGYDMASFRFFNHPSTGTQAFFLSCREHGILAFRGTETERADDWTRDFTGVRYKYPYADASLTAHLVANHARLLGYSPLRLAIESELGTRADSNIIYESGYGVHLGFLLAFEPVRAAIELAVRTFLDGGTRTLFVTGHSLGGALAVHAAAYFRHVFGRRARTRLYTYGQPRVGDDRWAKLYRGDFQYVRARNNDDIVPTVPISRPDLELREPYYAHFGKLVRFRHGGEDLQIRSHPNQVEAYDENYTRMAEVHWANVDGDIARTVQERSERHEELPETSFLNHRMSEYLERVLSETIASCEDWYWDRPTPRTRAPFLNGPRLGENGAPRNWLTESHAGMFLAHNGRRLR